ncbi:MAG: alpha/beta hydrolase [Ferruginibacter sp.]|nr:alpha/beta hydrolase [Ferruginibacter sp.]
MKTIYCISGLGADERAFSRLKQEGYNITCLPWLTPLPNEGITDYAARMCKVITTEKPVLMGLSFGGMMSIEIAKLLPVEKVILISSIKSTMELPRWMRTAGKLRLNKILPMRSFKITEPIQNRFIGITQPDEIEMVRSYRRNAPQVYMDWAINEVLKWRNDWQPPSLFHVHGDADRIFPINKLAPTHIIKDGGHFMIMNKAAEVNAALRDILAS